VTEQARTVRLGTRGSALARWQTDHIAARLREAYPALSTEIVVFSTRGDQVVDVPLPKIGGKGLFTAELEDALRKGVIDLAVHSLKDLPTEDPDGLMVGAIPARAATNDVLVSRAGYSLDTLPESAVIGSSSHRRAGQLLAVRPDIRIADIRGNIDTRVKKALDPLGVYDAIMLAQSGLDRLGYSDVISQILPLDVMLPAPGQGALAVQCRADAASWGLLTPLDHLPTRCAVLAERAFLAALGGGCSVPVAAYGTVRGSELHLQGRIVALDGSHQVDVAFATSLPEGCEVNAAEALGQHLAAMALQQGANRILPLSEV
jgi:hydroxymethylbilane synthase